MGSTRRQAKVHRPWPRRRSALVSGVRCAREFKIASAACTSILYHICHDPMNTPVREGEPIEMSRTMRNRPYPVWQCSKVLTKSNRAIAQHEMISNSVINHV